MKIGLMVLCALFVLGSDGTGLYHKRLPVIFDVGGSPHHGILHLGVYEQDRPEQKQAGDSGSIPHGHHLHTDFCIQCCAYAVG